MRISSLLIVAPLVTAARPYRAGTVELCADTQYKNCKTMGVYAKYLDKCEDVPGGDNLSSVKVDRIVCHFFTDAGCTGSSFSVSDGIPRLTVYQGGKFNDNVKSYKCEQ
ncbi:hypothetical protein NLG97_g9715 [Lecanicillium saksenae]|uniref:Uncharacterized protein n=1 Tax=Lecanicillium saksenae TaxID=468837 RepID=A0ACC1QGX3_9HYPO|nr:hypothetical protein NLG97_g9715 [Lecanicillium saksenae]